MNTNDKDRNGTTDKERNIAQLVIKILTYILTAIGGYIAGM